MVYSGQFVHYIDNLPHNEHMNVFPREDKLWLYNSEHMLYACPNILSFYGALGSCTGLTFL